MKSYKEAFGFLFFLAYVNLWDNISFPAITLLIKGASTC